MEDFLQIKMSAFSKGKNFIDICICEKIVVKLKTILNFRVIKAYYDRRKITEKDNSCLSLYK